MAYRMEKVKKTLPYCSEAKLGECEGEIGAEKKLDFYSWIAYTNTTDMILLCVYTY